MDSLLFLGEADVPFASGATSCSSLLEQYVQYACKDLPVEQMILFALICDRIFPQQADITAALNSFAQSYTNYKSAQQLLQVASKRFFEANAELQTNLYLFRNLLSNVAEKVNVSAPPSHSC